MSVQKPNWSQFRKIFFQEDLPPEDVQDVLNAANLLEIPEFEVFRLAYAYWYGRMPSEEEIETVYVPYMFEGIVPLFVRQFSRRVHAMRKAGAVDRRELGMKEPPTVFRNIRMGVLIFVLLFMVQIMFYYMASYTAVEFPLLVGRCFLPPCY